MAQDQLPTGATGTGHPAQPVGLFTRPAEAVGGPPPEPAADPLAGAVGTSFTFLLLATAALALVWLGSGIRVVDAGSQAVVRRFGAIDRIAGPGLLLALPAPWEDVQLLPGPERQLKLDIPALDLPNRETATTLPQTLVGDPRMVGGYALSGDAGIVHLRGSVVYQVSDPAVYAVADPEGRLADGFPPTALPALRRATQAALISACAGRNLDAVLVASPDSVDAQRNEALAASRERLRADVLRELNRRLAGLGLGLVAARVDVAAYLPEKARPAFDGVIAAESSAARDVAEARTAATKMQQESAAACATLITQAQAKAKELIATARVATDRVRAVMGEQEPAKRQVLLTRLYRERVDGILARAGSTTLIGGANGAKVLVPGR